MTVEQNYAMPDSATPFALAADPSQYVFWHLDVPAGATDLYVHLAEGGTSNMWYGINQKPVPGDISSSDVPPASGFDGQVPGVGLGEYALSVETPAAGRWWFYMNGLTSAASVVTVYATFVGKTAIWTDLVGCVER